MDWLGRVHLSFCPDRAPFRTHHHVPAGPAWRSGWRTRNMDWLSFLRPPRLYDLLENDRQFYLKAEANPRPQEYASDQEEPLP